MLFDDVLTTCYLGLTTCYLGLSGMRAGLGLEATVGPLRPHRRRALGAKALVQESTATMVDQPITLALRVLSCRDISQPPPSPGASARPPRGQRLLKLQLTDGETMFEALEHSALPFLPKTGDELQLRNASRVSGVLLLAPSSCQLLAGSVQAEDGECRPTKDAVALSWARGDVDDSDPPPRFTQVLESAQAEAPPRHRKTLA